MRNEATRGRTLQRVLENAMLPVVTGNSAADAGVGIGSMLAIVCSWQRNRSVLWAILAGILSWFYVNYFAATRRADERK